MGNNVNITEGLNRTIGTDEVGGVNYQIVKIGVSAAGVAPAQVSTANPLPTMFGLMSTDLTEVAINHAANGDNTIVAAQGAGNKIRVWAWWLKVNGSGTGVSLKWKDGAGADFHPALPFNDKDGWVMGMMGGRPWFTGTANTALILNLSAAIQVSGRAYYSVST